MASEILKLTAEVIISHASMTELSTQELVDEIKEIYGVLSSLESGMAPEIVASAPATALAVKTALNFEIHRYGKICGTRLTVRKEMPDFESTYQKSPRVNAKRIP